jgi:hypothetical protein
MATRAGRRTLRLGPSYRVSINASLKAELFALLPATAAEPEPEPEPEPDAATAAA